MSRQETKQWNLNQTVGWNGANPDDFTVLFIKSNHMAATSNHIAGKRKFDEAVLQELKTNRIGDQAEKDEQGERIFILLFLRITKKQLLLFFQ